MPRVYFQRTKWNLSLSNLLQPKCYTSIIITDHGTYFSCFNHHIEENHLPWFKPQKLDSNWFLLPDKIFKSVTSAYHLWGSNFFDHPDKSYSLMLSMLQSLLLTVSFLYSFYYFWFSMGFVQFSGFFIKWQLQLPP